MKTNGYLTDALTSRDGLVECQIHRREKPPQPGDYKCVSEQLGSNLAVGEPGDQ